MSSKVIYSNQSGLRQLPPVAFMKQCVLDTLAHQKKGGEVSLCLLDKQTMRGLNLQHRQKDYATNVLSFPATMPFEMKQPIVFLGDILLCPAVAIEEALAQNKTLQDHMVHLLVHGTLHLLGYDHEQDEDANVMEALEIRLLQKMNIHNPYDRGSRESRT